MTLIRQALTIARMEAEYFARHRKLLIATLVVVLIPALYALIYLASVWDPGAKTTALSVAIVNLDKGMNYRNQVFNIGDEVVTKLKANGRFGFKDFTDEQLARRQVRTGELAFALIIPAEFSTNAIPGTAAGAGKPVVYVSEGNNIESAEMARQFAEALGEQINDSLNEQRWAMVLNSAIGSQLSVEKLRAGVNQLSRGAKQLSSGAEQTAAGSHEILTGSDKLRGGVTQLTSGVKQLGNGLRLMDSRKPSNAELNQLKSGADKLAAAHVEFGHGLKELQAGSQKLVEGVATFQEQAGNSIWAPAALTEGLGQLSAGTAKLDNGVDTAAEAEAQLADGANQLSVGVGKLTNGMRTLGNGIHTMVTQLPLTSQLDELASGASVLTAGTEKLSNANKSLAQGAQLLAVGIDQLARSLPDNVPKPDGNPQGLAHSVEPIVERAAPVRNSGSGFAANVIPAALWLGAGIAAFLLHVRVLPLEAIDYSRPAQVLGKIMLPGALVLTQSAIILLLVLFVLKVHIVNPGAFTLTLAISSLSFLMITFALTRAFGDAGKGLAMILLAVQLSSSGGIMPVELSGRLFMDISPWLPLTWVVKALKASMFGAYDGDWLHPLLLASLGGIAGAVMACTIGKWRFANAANIRPAIDI